VVPLAGDLQLLKAGAYVVDPLGNLVLWYSYDDVGKPLLNDLKRLLKVSQIG
jgi:cytochrome oxidase Cu insertion factor (SCO1/SenC/PrrC family)